MSYPSTHEVQEDDALCNLMLVRLADLFYYNRHLQQNFPFSISVSICLELLIKELLQYSPITHLGTLLYPSVDLHSYKFVTVLKKQLMVKVDISEFVSIIATPQS